MSAEWNLDAAAEAIKSAGFDPARWPTALSFLSDTISSAGCVIFSADQHVAHAPSSANLQKTMVEYSEGGWYDRDRRREGVPSMLCNGIMTDRDISEQAFKSDFYRDFLMHHKCEHFAGIGFVTGKDLWCLSMQRSAEHGSFASDELDRLRTLWRPLADAATLTRVLADRHALATVDSLELVQHAAIICDNNGDVLAFNQSAKNLLGPIDGFKKRNLTFSNSNSNSAYLKLMAAALRGAISTDVRPLSTTLLDDAGRRVTVRAISLANRNEYVFYGANVLLLFKVLAPNLREIMSRYRLTSAEFETVCGLNSGDSVGQMARKRGIQDNSIRVQLKSIYGKVNVHSQSQLLALIHKNRGFEE